MNTHARNLTLPRPWARTAPSNWPFLAFVALIPLQNIYLQYVPNLGGGLNFLNVMFIVSLLGAWRCGGSTVPGTGVNGWMMAYVFYSCLALVIGIGTVADTSGHASMLKDHLIAVAFLFLAQMSAIDRAGVRRLFLASLVPLPYIAWVISTQLAWASSWHYSHDLRVRGTFMELGANELGAFCVTVLMMTGGLLLAARTSLYWKIALAVGFGLAAYGIVSSYSRTAYIASIAGLALIILFPPGRGRRILPLLAVAALVWALAPPAAVERFDSITLEAGQRDESTENRFLFWEVAAARFRERPIFGTGFATFQSPEVNPYETDAHNFFLRELVEKGLIGGVIVLGLLLSIVRLARRAARWQPPTTWTHGYMVGLLAALLALVIGNLFGDRFTHYPMIAHFWLYVGLALRLWQLELAEARERGP